MSRRRYSLTALRAFEAAGRTNSLTAAARELVVTRPAVSNQIRLLEEELGCQLFRRYKSRVELTDTGAELLSGLTRAFDLMLEATDRARYRAASASTLRVLAETDFASSWLATNIGRFLIENPGISVDLVSEKQGSLHLDEDFNFRIFYFEEPISGNSLADFEARELCRWVNLPLCAPNYLEGSRAPETILRGENLLHDRDKCLWADWLRRTGSDESMIEVGGTVFNGTALCLSAAESGAGIAIGDSFIAYDHLREGRLVPPFADAVRSNSRYFLIYSRSGYGSSQEKAFEAWITMELENHTERIDQMLSDLSVTIL